MRFPVAGLAVALLSPLLIAGCNLPGGVVVGAPSPQTIALQGGDVPKDLLRCPFSGGIDAYLAGLKGANPEAYNATFDSWRKLKDAGARDAAIVSYAADRTACNGEFGTGQGRTAATFVVQFKDAQAAQEGFRRGIAGFPSPAAGEPIAGLTRGAGTGLGTNSWKLDRQVQGRSLSLAYWQRNSYDVFYVAEDLDSGEARRSLDAVDHRVS